MDAISESRQGVLAVAKAKLIVARNLKIKGQVEKLEPTHYGENPIFAAVNLRSPDPLSTKPQDIKRGAVTILKKKKREDGQNSFLERETLRKSHFLEDSH